MTFITQECFKRQKRGRVSGDPSARSGPLTTRRLAAIQKSRWVEAVTILGSGAASQLSGADLSKLLSLFEGSVKDVTKTLLVNGYSRKQEEAADESALSYLHRVGYNPHSLPMFLAVQQQSVRRSGYSPPSKDGSAPKQLKAILPKQWPRTEVKDGPNVFANSNLTGSLGGFHCNGRLTRL
jgi:hypothetical protein